jgi:hypothetical protein
MLLSSAAMIFVRIVHDVLALFEAFTKKCILYMDKIKNRMAELTQFPKTNKELADLKKGPIVRFPANEEEYWALAEESELRLDF